MIKFFRKIRQRLLTENKFSRYLLYASGEIILVVIGILIALQINTWNHERLNEKEKKELLAKLHSEFKANKKELINNRIRENSAISSSVVLMNLIGASEKELLQHNLDSLLFESFPSNELAFSNNAVNNIIQNGRLNLFENSSINELLNQWNSLEEIRKVRIEKLDSWNNEQLLPYLLDYISFKEMDSNAGYMWTGKSKVKPNYYPLFQSIKFENLLDNSLWLHQNIIDRLYEAEKLVDEIIKTTNPEKLE
ncbi:DUF6090 family protein [Constantimarinum furrinae]|uniref:Uncharacterized protein n=1 Tax=Constantimarinum furrinae TaxID=2562285 RepID=A0A7G8PUX0_9FLAO|nr:DUF6090 family protein [Constantimarinum furrinae]QNJ98136.1 hypothetical protein ALE3EI_1578 [Constantimarinum furrinae]